MLDGWCCLSAFLLFQNFLCVSCPILHMKKVIKYDIKNNEWLSWFERLPIHQTVVDLIPGQACIGGN